MTDKGFKSVGEMVGKAIPNVKTWENLNLNYQIIAEINKEKCICCQLCYIACEDGAHQAIGLSNNGNRVPYIIEENCVGCNLCSIVCPVEGCISMIRTDDGEISETWKERTHAGNIPVKFDDPLAGGLHHKVPDPLSALKK